MFRRFSRNRKGGFSLIEVMVSMTMIVVGLMALASASSTTSLLRKRNLEEDRVFQGMVDQLEWVRGELFADTPFYDNVRAAMAAGQPHQQGFRLDSDGDGIQDLSFSAGDQATPVLNVTVQAPIAPADSDDLLVVQIDAQWYGIGGNRTRTLGCLVANRSGFGN